MPGDQLPAKILLVDSDQTVLGPLIDPFEKLKVEIFAAHDLQTALYRFNKQFFKVVLIENRFPELDGVALIQRFRSHSVLEKSLASFILIVHSGQTKQQQSLLNELGQIQTITKPLNWATLVSHIQKAHKIAIRRELLHKLKSEIRGEMDTNFDFARLNQKIDDLKSMLAEEYIPLKIELFEKANQPAAALTFIEHLDADKIDPLRKLNMQGRLHLKLGQLESAQKAFEEADRLAPANLERVTQMVELYLEMRVPDKAIEKQKQLLGFNPDQPDLKFDLFKQLEQHGFADEAAAFCREITGPREVVTYFNNKGVVLAQTQQLAEAIKEYERAINYYPNHKSVHAIHFNLALAHLKTKLQVHLEPALYHLHRALELNPEYDKARQLLAKLNQSARSA